MQHLIKKFKYFAIIIPFLFSLFFWQLLPVTFDAIFYLDNIKGKGTCSSYISSKDVSFAYLYKGDTRFDSDLKTLRLRDIKYNVNEVTLYIYDVNEADIISFDISVFGFIVSHLNIDGLSHPLKRDNSFDAVSTSEEPLIHAVLENPKEGTSISLTGFAFIPAWVWAFYIGAVIIISLLLAYVCGFLLERLSVLRLPVYSASVIMTVMIMGCFFCGSFPYVNYKHFLLNWLLIYAVSLIINALTLPWIGTILVGISAFLWYIANFYMISFRGKPIMPADLKAASTAAEVVSGYVFSPTWKLVAGIIVVVLYFVIFVFWYREDRKKYERLSLMKNLILRSITIGIAVVSIALGVNSNVFKSLNSFQWDAKVLDGFHREGAFLTFLKSYMSSQVRKPEGYSKDVVNRYLEDCLDDEIRTNGVNDEETNPVLKTESNTFDAVAVSDKIQPTNIIMIMNEAFSDLRTVGLDENIDVMPFIDSLQDSIIEGDLYVSVFGGGTCNTEFEALTGNSLAFFPPGAYPYTENVTDPLFSLAEYFKNLNYKTDAFHANSATNWNRNIVYPNLGFDLFHSIIDYPELTKENYLHGHPADIGDYLYMEQVSIENAGHPRFLFDVTMQNHSGYDYFEDVKEDKSVVKYGKNLEQEARVYLSLIKASNDALKQLIEMFKDYNEPTMIIFFGDHQPGFDTMTQEKIYTSVTRHLDYYKTKFFIWTNYETETEHDVQISANYLPWLILERGNFALPPYVQMLKELHEKYPIISAQGVMDADGNVYTGVAEVMDDPLIKKYQYIQYANMFDEIDPAWFEVK